jgi:phosphonate metabolism-associated iron-containing alcohol dehydrogenase
MQHDDIPRLSGHPTLIHFGAGVTDALPAALPAGARVLVVSSTGTRARVYGLLRRLHERLELVLVEDVPAEVTLESITALVNRQRAQACDYVLAIGGGATMDAAKALAIGIRTEEPLAAILHEPGRFAQGVPPVVCVPTTSGSGSDVTPYATIWDRAAGCKRSLSHSTLYPMASWIDPKLTLTLPEDVTATSGLDALSHAMEAIWSKNHTPPTDALAAAAVHLIIENLPAAMSRGSPDARTEMSRAALAAGLAISRTQTAAAHAGSYPLTLRHRIPHGYACALSLPWLLRWHGKNCPDRIKILTTALGVTDAEAGARAVESLIADMGLSTRLRDLGVKDTDLAPIVDAAMRSDRMRNTVEALTMDQVDTMFRTIW